MEANNTTYDMELRNQEFETQVERHEEITTFEEVVEKSLLGNENVYT